MISLLLHQSELGRGCLTLAVGSVDTDAVPVPEPLKSRPVSVWLFTGIVLLWQATFLALNPGYVREDPVWAGAWGAFGLASLAALVVWRQRWAWWLYLAGPVYYLLSPALGVRVHPAWDIAELALLVLLVSPSMRRYVFAGRVRRRRPRPDRAWSVPLVLSGAITVFIAVPVRHPAAHAVGTRVIAWVIFWLALAALMRLIAVGFRATRQLLRTRRETPPPA